MELEEPLQQGILLLPPQGMLGQLKKTWHKKFCQLFNASRYGIERLEIYDNQEEAVNHQLTQRIITLEACVKISRSNQPNVFTVVTKTGVYHFGCFLEAETASWLNSFQSVAFKDNISSSIIEEDNELYCSSGEGVFLVHLVETEASKRCKLEPKPYTLVVAAADIKLKDGNVNIYTWPYRYIRRYGHRDGKFTFEAGRKCNSGEGSFCLQHKNQQDIFKCISSKMKSMKKMLGSDDHFQAALFMEPGSRSPLPPSPNPVPNLIDFESLAKSSVTSNSNTDSITSIKPPILKPKPAKPPRKYGFTTISDKKSIDSEIIDISTNGKYRKLNSPTLSDVENLNTSVTTETPKNSYDMVEVRSDAWKTHGIDEVIHVERPKHLKLLSNNEELDDSQYETMFAIPVSITSSTSSKSKNNDEVLTPASSIIHHSPCTDPLNYDKLQHFSSIHKINHKPGYRTPNCSSVSQSSQATTPVSPDSSSQKWSNYDIVEDLSSVRLADDSHHGYGMIRKKSNNSLSSINTSVSNNSNSNLIQPKYKIVNESEYAIVSKPKRV